MRRVLIGLLGLCLLGMLFVSASHGGASAQGGGTPAANAVIHIIQDGESLYVIAQLYGVSVDAIMAANGITDGRFIEAGQELIIPNVASPTSPPAQDTTTVSSAQNIDINHTIQDGETLASIAVAYGVTVDNILAANGLKDAGMIQTGQVLIIPNVSPDKQTPPPVIIERYEGRYRAQAGESLHSIALRFDVSVHELAALNNISHPWRVYAGQDLMIVSNRGETGRTDITYYTVQNGDNIFRIAAQFNTPVATLLALNGWERVAPLWAGQRIIVQGQRDGNLLDLPQPLTDLRVTALPAFQGETISLHFTTSQAITPTLLFMGRPVQVAHIDDTHYIAMLGIHTLANPGVYEIDLTLALPDGSTLRYPVHFQVLAWDYDSEAIPMSPEQQALLDNGIMQSEQEMINTIMSQFTPQKYFAGLMSLPYNGNITSDFGTRRTYGENTSLTFHSGTDFGGAPGASITAPASGTVVLAQSLQVRGNAVIIDHGWGVYSGYWHQTEFFVQEGQYIQQGQIIGTIGSTGLSTGPHLHWELWVSGVQVNPLQWTREILD